MRYELEHHDVITNGITLHVVQCGPQDGPLIILLHGFPEFWYSWRRQIPALAEAGYRVWAPDQRGYNLSDKPTQVAAYKMPALAADIIGLIDAAGHERAFLVGHDWGALVAWNLAAYFPARVARVAILNVPHPRVMAQELRHSIRQLSKSWYIFFFQLSWLPEKAFSFNNYQLGEQTLRGTSRRGAFSTEDLKLYRAAWAQPRAITSMLNWYRAAARYVRQLNPPGRVRVPIHIVWGKHDAFLNPNMAQESLAWCEAGRLTYFEKSTHWVQHEDSEAVNELLLRFFGHPHENGGQ
ncbi:alpha/beta hydrolase [Hymenobacter sp. BT188]|uniref:alpha/beta fold hydrolase n=1 Tax=Hymenobacter sp. BT188 TaxID=2763504 RepID=UPI0016511EE6|nr:alpha/beta hydrolase [Hymenobacter sp. BT188]MBC6607048.1 alpha/beta hydrolase [Hymenobacter sp. BT188]